ncbi:MAG: PKD domain-containing protein [Flavobacteriia bacterium]|jgi:hypothetical protein
MNKFILLLTFFICWNLQSQIAVISANDSTICAGQKLIFSSSLSLAGNSPILYTSWTISGNGINIQDTLPFLNNFEVILDSSGFYNVSIINIHEDLSESTHTNTQFIQVYSKPHASFSISELGQGPVITGDPVTCPPIEIIFSDQSTSANTITNWNWYTSNNPINFPFFSNITSNLQNPASVIYNLPGNFHIMLVIVDINGCRDTTALSNFLTILGPSANPYLIQIPSICGQDFSLNITDLDLVGNYTWEISDNTIYSSNNVGDTILNHHFEAPGSYFSNFTIEDLNGCEVSYLDTIMIAPNGVDAEFNSSQIYLSTNDSLHFTDISTNLVGSIQYRIWNYGDGLNDTLTSETENAHHYQNPGLYTSSLKIVNQAGCSDIYSEEIQVVSTQTSNSFPNPATQILNFYHFDYQTIANLHILDFNGVEILTIPLINNPQNIDVSGLTNGMYFLKYWLNNDWVYEQFMVLN